MKVIQFCVSRDAEGDIYSRVGSEVIRSSVCYESDPDEGVHLYEIGVLDQRISVFRAGRWLDNGLWTKKIPIEWKNEHRKAWGLPLLKEERVLPEWYLDWNSIYVPTPENVGDFPEGVDDWMASVQSKKAHWYGDRGNFKTWVFEAPLVVVRDGLAPLLEGSDFSAKLKGWRDLTMKPDSSPCTRFIDGIPVFVPNSVWNGDGFYISHNTVDRNIYGDETTALVTTSDVTEFYILNGDHREQYIALIDGGYEACKAYFDSVPELHNRMSDTPETLEKWRSCLRKQN